MRRLVVPALSLALFGLAACGSAAPEAARSTTTRKAAAPATVPAPRQSDRVLILANREGTVSVVPATGEVAFRAPFGVAAPDSSTVVQAQPIASGTRVVASDPLTGVPRWSHDVAGTRRARVVSPGGKFVALVDGTLTMPSTPRESTVVHIATESGIRPVSLKGNFDPEAFSVNGRYLYALEFIPAMDPSRYSVRRVDLETGKIESVPDRDGGVRDPMPGYARTQLMSPDGQQLYTYYATTEPVHENGVTYHAWVHVLNLAEGWAYCAALDERIGETEYVSAGLAVTPDGSRLFVTDGAVNAIAELDTKSLDVVRTRFLPELANTEDAAVVATDGETVFARDRFGRLAAIDAQTLAPKSLTISGAAGISGLRTDARGQVLYLLTQDGVLVADRSGRVLQRWPSPGDSMSLDPSVSVPGSGAYQCAC